ncbi:MAG TPA: catalase [Thermoanaerobaculia bacterium]|nr:catalase [Thermoanaerobaculia bacterium]
MKSPSRPNKKSPTPAQRAEPEPRTPQAASPSKNRESGPVNPDLAAGQSSSPARPANPKAADLGVYKEDGAGKILTTNQGTRVNDNQNTLKAGERGPSLLEDFHFREKMTHFDHERIPERIVHARGSAAHGYFQVYENMSRYTKAGFLQDPSVRTPVFVRFSTVVGSRGSTDLARDVRGFAVKFYTEEGIFDLVGNNIPVFFIQDAIKFPDLVHAVKPEPDHEMPQAASAHDTFWDFVSLMPESMHMVMWVMSDRALPRSFRMMEGFGVHTFRFIDGVGNSRFVKFHWKPLLGTHAVAWDEAQKISGKDPDFLRRDLWEAIDQGNYPEWELGVQIVDESREHEFDFDLLDPTKLIPEELVPVERIGRLTLNRNPDNFFAETEQVAFHPGHIVPGIDFTNDPLLQGRLFSYTDTQLKRLGGPNFHEIPINRPIAPVHNNQRDGHMRQTINRGKVAYEPNSIGGGCPMQAGSLAGGFTSFAERLEGTKIRARSEKFFDHFSQATLFVSSQSAPEKDHMVEALRFELGKVERLPIRQRMVAMLNLIDEDLAARVAEGLGFPEIPPLELPINHSIPADGDPDAFQPRTFGAVPAPSPALSMANTVKNTVATRRVAILASDGVDTASLKQVKDALEQSGAAAKIVAPRLGTLAGADGDRLLIDFSLLTTSSVLFDAVYVPGGTDSVNDLVAERDAIEFVTEAWRHCKPIAATGEGVELLRACPGVLEPGSGKGDGSDASPLGVLTSSGPASPSLIQRFVEAIAQHRFWERSPKNKARGAGDDTRGRTKKN